MPKIDSFTYCEKLKGYGVFNLVFETIKFSYKYFLYESNQLHIETYLYSYVRQIHKKG